MADDALTRKDAEMGRLTRETRETAALDLAQQAIASIGSFDRGLQDYYLTKLKTVRALALESVREEALEEAAKVVEEMSGQLVEKEVSYHGWDKHGHGDVATAYITCIRALQHAPARVAEGCAHEWTDATNHVVLGTEICLKCFELRGMSARAPKSPAKEQPGEYDGNI